jgi:uncharacterized membrane protein
MEAIMSQAKKYLPGALMFLGSISGFTASFLLTVDKIALLKDSQFVPSCNISETLNCKSVMLSEQAEVFGFPNSLIGIGAFAIFIALSIAVLAGTGFPSWFWKIALGGTAIAVIFCHWLAYQTTFVIGALCPYCMVAWSGTLLIFSSIIQELLRPRIEQNSEKSAAVAKISQVLPIFHILWTAILIGSAFVGVN